MIQKEEMAVLRLKAGFSRLPEDRKSEVLGMAEALAFVQKDGKDASIAQAVIRFDKRLLDNFKRDV